MKAVRPRLGADLLALLPVVLAILGFYAWTVGSNAPEPMVARHQGDYYNLLTEGLAEGHLYLNATVNPILLLPPAKRGPSYEYLLDASYYRGHYYLYFGVTPALTLFLPFRLLTGLELNQLVVVGAQGMAAFLAGMGLLLVVRRELAPTASRLALIGAAVAWGFGSALPVALRKPHMYEVAITAGMAWSTAFLLCAALAILRPARTGRWLALASLCAGLAVGSRPNLLIGSAALVGVLAWVIGQARRHGGLPRARALRWVAAAVGPAALCGCGLLLYNGLRFHDPLEFGHRYQLGSDAAGFVSLRYFWHNLQLYYLTPPAAGWLFPFFAEGIEGARPAGYVGVEPVHAQLFCLVWFGLLAALVAWGRRAEARDSRRKMVGGLLLWWFGANFLALACLSVRANRYLLDFHPALVLVGGFLMLDASALPRPAVRRAAVLLGWTGIAAIVVFNAGISVETMGFMRRVNPVGYARLERACNRLAWPIFRLTNPRFGPRVFQVSFAAARPGSSEPLISAGPPLDGSALLIHYLEHGQAQLVLTTNQISTDHVSGPQGPPFALRPGERRQLTVELGAFFPPIGHPWYGAASAADMQRRATTNCVLLDGQEVFHLSAVSRPASPAQILIGRRRTWASSAPDRFSGSLQPRPASPLDLTEPAPPPGAGWGYRLVLRLPTDRFGLAEPLLTTGTWPVGDAFLLRYRDPQSVELLHDQIGGGLIGSTVIPVDYAQPQTFDLWFDPAPMGDGALRYRLSLFRAGRPVLLEKTPLQPFAFGQEALGAGVIPSSLARDTFGGEVLSVSRTDSANVSRRVVPEHNESIAAVRFRLPPAPDGLAQPLLNFRRADGGQGLLALRRAGRNTQVGWRDGAGWWWSRVLDTAAGDSHTVGVQWSLAEPAGDGAGGPAMRPVEAMVVVDGMICPLPRPEFFSAPITHLAAWNNPWPEDATAAGHFSGTIEPAPIVRTLLAMGRATLPARHFRLAVRFPSNRPGRNEPLVTVGRTGSADGLYVHYERGGWVRIGFDHWGKGGPVSSPVPVARDGYDMIDVAFGSGPWSSGGSGRLSVSANGRPILDAPVDFYAARAGEAVIGTNEVGLSTSDRHFTGEMFPVEALGQE